MIEVKDVYKTYKTGEIYVEALKGISLTIDKGEMVVFAGPSGSGKTTLLNAIGGMDVLSKGNLVVDGEDITRYSKRALTSFRARKVGFIFQNFHLISSLNVYENIVVPLKLKNQTFRKEDAIAVIDRVGLKEHIKHKPDELSGGQRQRVAIARALVHRPPYILADEPTANLDSHTGLEIIALLKELNKEYGVTVIFASHDEDILQSIPRKVHIRDGMMVDDTAKK